jgi:phytoene synthase
VTPHAYCQQRAASSGSSFYYSFLFLPLEQRRAITALYAFCREIDDVVDGVTDPSVAHAKLAWWEAELTRIYEGGAQHPVGIALAPVVQAYGLPREQMHDILAGMRMDLEYNRYPDFATLEAYCHRVAGVVGLQSARIFGFSDPATLEYARTLGIALQLINIIRDVGEDARRNRIYLPLDELSRFGLRTDDIIGLREDRRLLDLIDFQIQRANAVYRRALELLPAPDRKRQRAGLIMGAIYRTLLREIELAGGRVMNQRIALTPIRKLWIAWRTWVAA